MRHGARWPSPHATHSRSASSALSARRRGVANTEVTSGGTSTSTTTSSLCSTCGVAVVWQLAKSRACSPGFVSRRASSSCNRATCTPHWWLQYLLRSLWVKSMRRRIHPHITHERRAVAHHRTNTGSTHRLGRLHSGAMHWLNGSPTTYWWRAAAIAGFATYASLGMWWHRVRCLRARHESQR